MSRIIYTPQEPDFVKKKIKRKNKNFAYTLGITILVLVITTILIYAVQQPYFRIRKIEYSGRVVVSESDLQGEMASSLSGYYLGLIPKDFYLAVDSQKISKHLISKIPRIESAVAVRKFPGTLQVSIKERELFGILCQRPTQASSTIPEFYGPETPTPKCAFLDRKGVAYEEALGSQGSLIPKLWIDALSNESGWMLGRAALDEFKIRQMEAAAAAFQQATGQALVGYQLFSRIPGEFRAIDSEGRRIYLNFKDDFKKVFAVLKTVIEQEIKEKKSQLEYLDLRFGNKVFYKFKNFNNPVEEK